MLVHKWGKVYKFTFKNRKCWICSSKFAPTCGTDRFCSIACRKEGRRRYKRLYYSKNATKIYQQGLKYLPRRIARQKAMRLFRKLGIISCEECGDKYRLQVHHKDKNSFNNDKENLVMLCLVCHSKKHYGNGFQGLESSPGNSLSNKTSA